MDKRYPVFLATAASGTTALALAIFLFSPLKVHAYAVGPVTPSASSSSSSSSIQNYDFGSSFQNLISPFTGFFNGLQSSGGVISVGGGTGSTAVTVTVDTRPYVSQFDSWFYGYTGVHIESFTNAVMNFFGWLFSALGSAAVWLSGSLKGFIK
ncbi:MAG: hypothetical protein P4L67_01070 [Candidatus Pacebacteria bacterium]|nr:hypothetical protein [Candidatus Paceibacterota bacterium]